jgi:hypothetical protein
VGNPNVLNLNSTALGNWDELPKFLQGIFTNPDPLVVKA